ncbi:MAG TPA: serine hydrolase domain-containing protein [Steroidobacteraceae bacterium]|nr:serine hydrolase domain-containing protein [Steroidobacteraceae bacterium]
MIMNRRRVPRVTTFIASTLIVLTAHAQSAPKANPLETRAKEFARAVSTGRPEELKQLAETFGGYLPNIPMPARIDTLMNFWDQSRGLTFQRLVNPTDVETLTLLKDHLSGALGTLAIFKNHLTGSPYALFLAVEREDPHRIVGFWPLDQLHKRMPEEVRPAVSRVRLSDRQIARELKAFTERMARADVFSGVVALAHDGAPVFEAAYGESNKEIHIENRLDKKFNLASMGKMFTAIAIAQLVQGGELSYEDPLSKFLPDFPDAESAKKIKIKHLLSHTSGLPMGNARPPNSSPRTLDDFLAAISEPTRLQFEPGAGYQYSNIGFLVLGKVIEKTSGQSYYEYVATHILEPAGMRDTVFEILDPAHRDFAIGYAKKFDVEGKALFENNASPHRGMAGPHGGAYSTIADLLRFDRALRGGKLLAAQTLKMLMAAKPELGASAYGYGFDVNATYGTAGHAGGFQGISNNIDFYVQSGWTAIVLSNYTVNLFETSAPLIVKMRELVEASASVGNQSGPLP